MIAILVRLKCAMRIFAVSDIHVDFDANRQWIESLSASDYRDDVVILGGDISDSMRLIEWCLKALTARFAKVLCVPGNHDLWVSRDGSCATSLEKFQRVREIIENCSASMQVFHRRGVSIVPLLGWYDYSFGEPTSELFDRWMDYRACRWPDHFTVGDVAQYFDRLNREPLETANDTVISFSHFVPRLDLLPVTVGADRQLLYPVLGSTRLEARIRRLKPLIHVYGHSHVNRHVRLEGITYVNNAFGYPSETLIAAKRLKCIHETA